jgi:hypothetical protein
MSDENALAKLTKAELADKIGAIHARAKKVGKELDALKEEFERRGLSIAEGDKFAVVRRLSKFMSLKIKAIRDEMGDAWCKKREEPGSKTYWDITGAAK